MTRWAPALEALAARVPPAALAAAVVLASSAPAAGQPRSGGPRPSILLVVADDLGLGDVPPLGDGRIRAPALERLVREGTRFSRAYAAAPVCAPSRCAILTGLHAGHCSVRRNRQPNVALGLSDPTLADALRAAGYRTAFVGKWGLGGEASPGTPFAHWSAPWNVGFERVHAVLDDAGAARPFPSGLWRDGRFVALAANAEGARGAWIASTLSDDAVATLDALLDGDAPFFLVVASTLPHREVFAPDLGAYARAPWPEAERTYAAMVSQLDTDVGRLVARLEARGALDRTLVVFASDHGPHGSDGHDVAFFGSSAGLRGEKRDLYEGGVRVPLFAFGGGAPRGAVVEEPVSLVDLFPTLAALAGAAAPDALDGQPLAILVGGSHDAGPAEPTDPRPAPAARPRAIFLGAAEANGGVEPPTRYALLEWPLVLVEREDGVTELYDLEADPRQTHDLASARGSDMERLRALRIAESTGSIVRADPILHLRGEGVELAPAGARAGAVVLDLDLATAEDAARASAPGASFPSRVAWPSLEALLVGGARGPAGATLDRGRGEHLVVASHPALSFGGESFGVEARVALRALAGSLEAAERQWLAVVKPTGTADGAIDWGVLVQAADVGAVAPGDAPTLTPPRPGALALVFGRGRLREDDTWAVRSRALAIEDTAAHELAVRFDAERRRVVFELDGAREEIELAEDLGHVRSDGPLVVGAHHDARGAFDGGLDGTLASFRLVRGASAAAPPAAPREVVLDVGPLEPGAAGATRRLTVASAASAPSRAMELSIERAPGASEPSDPRVSASLERSLVLGSADEGAALTVRVTPDVAGPIEETFILRGVALRLGHEAIGSPILLRVRGRVGTASVDAPEAAGTSNVIGWIEAAVLLAAVLAAVAALRRRP